MICYIFIMPHPSSCSHSHVFIFAILHRQSPTSRVRRGTNMYQILFSSIALALSGCADYAPLLDRVVERKVRSLSE